MVHLKVCACIEAKERETIIGPGLIPREVHKAKVPEKYLKGFSGTKAAYRMETLLTGNSVPVKGLQKASRAVIGLQDGDVPALAEENPSADQAAKSCANYDRVLRHSL
jgi:hypothetical protein